MKYKLIVIFSFLVLCPQSLTLSASVEDKSEELISIAKEKHSAQKATWLRLLHFRLNPKIEKKSEILSSQFFLADADNTERTVTRSITPEEELEATLKAFFQNVGENQDAHPICRFPARFQWLSEELSFSNYDLPKVECKRFNDWVKKDDLESVSFIMVSGYFGNPASAFGHSLIKLNNGGDRDNTGNLLDQSINFGAQVPDNEILPLYIYRGLTGKYTSVFADKEFYTQDLIYSKHEYRDMWEYELDLSDEQTLFLVSHIWEILGMDYTYYFLEKNCAYRMAELLELVTGEILTPNYQPWYLPVSMFQDLERIENSRYIKKINFLPSSQRELYESFKNLSNTQQTIVNDYLSNNHDDLGMGNSSDTSRGETIDFLLAYYRYRLSDGDLEDLDIEHLETKKNKLLKERFRLPITKKKTKLNTHLLSPAKSTLPRKFSAGLISNDLHGISYRIDIAGLYSDLLTVNTGGLGASSMRVLDLSLDLDKYEKATIRKFDIISIDKLGINKTKLFGEKNKTWNVAFGFRAKDLACVDCTNFYAKGGLGYAFGQSALRYSSAILNAVYNQETRSFSALPELRYVHSLADSMKLEGKYGYEYDLESGVGKNVWKFETRYLYNKDRQFSFVIENNITTEYSLNYAYHF